MYCEFISVRKTIVIAVVSIVFTVLHDFITQ
jgi:hypothetical protein